LPDDLNTSLNEIQEARPDLKDDPRFERLARYTRQVGG
jgi:hypothetical protein